MARAFKKNNTTNFNKKNIYIFRLIVILQFLLGERKK